MTRILGLLVALSLCCLAAGCGGNERAGVSGPMSEVVVTFDAPAVAGKTGSAGRVARARVDSEQSRFASALKETIPAASIHWRYRLVLNGAAVVVPSRSVSLLRTLPGVASVDASTAYSVGSARAADVVRAAKTWQTGLTNAGAGMKIGIIDDGVDQTHPYFSPVGYTMPPGFPKGQTAYTTAKVIVARAFAPASTTWKNARKPFDPLQSEHATHVAGIAAGDANTTATGGVKVSGIAPQAYIGNYKALTVPTDANVGLDGNSAEIVAAIEAAVEDGMNVINLSLGEPEVEPARDIVARALDAAAAAGVVPVVAAGNDFEDVGPGSLISPGTSDRAITVGAVTEPDASGSELADFSSSGPTPLSLRLKPDVSAPGVSILSSIPGGRWEAMSGTSMATPQISGAAALLRERHPTWSVAQLKAALMETGTAVTDGDKTAAPTRAGGGLANPLKADLPYVFASPSSVSFGLLHPGATASASIFLEDAAGGAGPWDVVVDPITTTAGATLTAPPTITVPGRLDLSAAIASTAVDGELTGSVRLTRGTDIRRIPFWLRVTRPALAASTAVPLRVPGAHSGNTRGKPARVSRYRYPDVPPGGIVNATLLGPEQLFSVTLTKPATNFGVVITSRKKGVKVEPRVVEEGDENRLTGYPALPTNLNPYVAQFGSAVLSAGAIRPLAATYDIVFDSATAAGAGAFTFRYWLNDTRPPSIRLPTHQVRRGSPLLIEMADAGSGIDITTIEIALDGRATTGSSLIVTRANDSLATLPLGTSRLEPGKHRLRIQVSDYQESRNMENVAPILPNTRVLSTTIVVK